MLHNPEQISFALLLGVEALDDLEHGLNVANRARLVCDVAFSISVAPISTACARRPTGRFLIPPPTKEARRYCESCRWHWR